MTTIKAFSIRAFELFAADGKSLGLFKVESEWQGMRKLVSISEASESAIVMASLPLIEAIENAFGEHRAELTVVKASPDLIIKLKLGTHS